MEGRTAGRCSVREVAEMLFGHDEVDGVWSGKGKGSGRSVMWSK